MKKQFVRFTMMAALIAISVSAFAQESVVLMYGFVPGKVYIQDSRLSQNITQTMGNQEMKIVHDIKSKSGFTVESTDNEGNATVLVSTLEMSAHSSVMGRDTTIQFKDMTDKSRIVYSPAGKSISTLKVDSTVNSALTAGQMNIGKLLLLPGRSVTTGERWKESVDENRNAASGTPFEIEIKGEMEFTLVGKEIRDGEEFVKVNYTSAMTLNGKVTQMGMEMFIEGTGKTEGFYLFDPQISLVVYSEDNTEMDMNVAVSGPQNLSIPMTQSMKTVITFSEKN